MILSYRPYGRKGRYHMHIVNQESVRVQITRGTLCDILIALTAVSQANPSATKWTRIHDELREILDRHDESAKEKGWRE